MEQLFSFLLEQGSQMLLYFYQKALAGDVSLQHPNWTGVFLSSPFFRACLSIQLLISYYLFPMPTFQFPNALSFPTLLHSLLAVSPTEITFVYVAKNIS
jgi:hypothetical protein